MELALAWLYQEYVIAQGYIREDDPRTDYEQYDACLCGLLQALKDKLEPRDRCDKQELCIYLVVVIGY